MRHGKKFKGLSRQKGHRKALLGNLAAELIKHKRIKTTLAKGKELKRYVEPILTRAKHDSTHSRRLVFKYLLSNEQAKGLVTELFREIGPKIAHRQGGYTRIIKLAPRLGDNAEMCYIELVDYNELLLSDQGTAQKKTRRSRRGTGATAKTNETATTETKAKKTKSDDLTKIEGVGPKTAEVLVAAGIVTFADVAKTSAEDIRTILSEAEGNFGAYDPETWPQQAQLAADGKWDELKKWQDELDGGRPADKDSTKEEE